MALEPEETLSIENLGKLRKTFDQLADLCQKHGETDGVTACRAIGRAITAEQVERSR